MTDPLEPLNRLKGIASPLAKMASRAGELKDLNFIPYDVYHHTLFTLTDGLSLSIRKLETKGIVSSSAVSEIVWFAHSIVTRPSTTHASQKIVAAIMKDLQESFPHESTKARASRCNDIIETAAAALEAVLKKKIAGLPAIESYLQDESAPKRNAAERVAPELESLRKSFSGALRHATETLQSREALFTFVSIMRKYANSAIPVADVEPINPIIDALRDVDVDLPVEKTISPEKFRSKLAREYKYLENHARNSPTTISVELVREFVKAVASFPTVFDKLTKKYFVTDEKKIASAAEAPSTAPLGQIAFADRRKDKKPYEPNTKREDELFIALRRHFDDNIALDAETSKELATLLKKGWYADVLKMPESSNIFRGIAVSKAWLAEALKIDPDDMREKGTVKKSFIYTPRSGSSSWSTNAAMAFNFATDSAENHRKLTYRVVLRARPDDNPHRFLTGPKGLYKVSGFDHNDQEREVVGLGKIRVYQIDWTESIS